MSTLTKRGGLSISTFVANTFMWMFAALLISAICAVWFANSPDIMASLIKKTTDGKEALTGLGWLVMLAPLIPAMIMIFGSRSISGTTASVLFILYAAINGMSFSFILMHYTAGSVFGCFLATSIMFAIFAVYGYTTKRDLTSMGNILFMMLIGLIVSLIINMFLGSAILDYVISAIGVVVFTLLTAYDVQKIKEHYYDGKNGSIMAAFTLYLDFVNLFLYILRLFGNSDD